MFNKSFRFSISSITAKALLLGVCAFSIVSAENYIVPPMIIIPAGDFMMCSETGSALTKPLHNVSISAFKMAKYPVTVAEFRKFAEATGLNPAANCKDHLDENWLGCPEDEGNASWDKHRYNGSEYLPVSCLA